MHLRPARLGVFSHVRPHLTIRVGILMMHPVGVHNGKDAAFERDLFAFEPERIALTVPSFVVFQDPVRNRG
ncbi:MAG: hypothetical protein PWR07_1941 [Bacillota bacterium]|nr:hypothetical protein [Bacillota bacterium]